MLSIDMLTTTNTIKRKRIIVATIACFVLQLTTFTLTHDFIVRGYTKGHNVTSDIGWGIFLQVIIIYYAILLIIQNIVDLTTNKNKFLVAILASVSFLPLGLFYLKSHPLRSINVTLIGIAILWTKYFWDYLFYKTFRQKYSD